MVIKVKPHVLYIPLFLKNRANLSTVWRIMRRTWIMWSPRRIEHPQSLWLQHMERQTGLIAAFLTPCAATVLSGSMPPCTSAFWDIISADSRPLPNPMTGGDFNNTTQPGQKDQESEWMRTDAVPHILVYVPDPPRCPAHSSATRLSWKSSRCDPHGLGHSH